MKTSEKIIVKHTPGHRWSLVENNNEAYLRIFSEKNLHMTYTLTNSRDEAVFPGGREEAKANARLIALSGRMLEAIKIAFQELDEIFLIRIPTRENEEVLNMLDNLIKQAEKK